MSLLHLCMLACFALAVREAQAEVRCEKVNNYKDVVECAEKHSPEVQKAESTWAEKSARVESATQLTNPDLSLQSVSGSLDSERKTETDVALTFPIELGGKRSARKQLASVEAARAQSDIYRAKSEVRREVYLKLLRLRHIQQEIELVDESIETFTKLVKQYEGRPARSPEQDVSLTVFKIAKSEYGFKRSEYEQELAAVEMYFQVTTGLNLDSLKKVSMPEIKSWPVSASPNGDLKKSPLAAAYEFDVQSARGAWDGEKADSWPTVNIGPSAKFTNESGRELQQWGFNLSMPIPLFNANGAGRAAAQASVQSSERKQELALKQLEADRKLFSNLYNKAVLSLKDSPSSTSLEGKHKKIESLFFKGLVPSSLVIESHRSLVEFEKTRNSHELKALNSLFNIQMIAGETIGVSL
ncbi:TolC family protein [Bdellovibrio sp. SKB1291214]|uniref:TolC family protein n=1 Tax=Bdellovibrio sp. SKB1291214 TaxID=1732569 RepID=UPI000B51DD64|nr:TolC family protein [Bdellovibrio sp. SKB1291214]UYL07364.1 TolC family protein [Bdellovibrio sp. SKB1291214]